MGQAATKDQRLVMRLQAEIERVEVAKRDFPTLDWNNEVSVNCHVRVRNVMCNSMLSIRIVSTMLLTLKYPTASLLFSRSRQCMPRHEPACPAIVLFLHAIFIRTQNIHAFATFDKTSYVCASIVSSLEHGRITWRVVRVTKRTACDQCRAGDQGICQDPPMFIRVFFEMEHEAVLDRSLVHRVWIDLWFIGYHKYEDCTTLFWSPKLER